ncbi:MAG: glucose-6-phosphate isomerase [Clostridia bacterium]|nr:glucose-6-phosphate isomerase [Clostridia bacterium]
MSIRLIDRYLDGFVSEKELSEMNGKALLALKTVLDGSGKGSDFLGWRALPDVPDKNEFARILSAAERIRKQCDVLVVIGIGGSYLGARAAIEYCQGLNRNALVKDGPQILFAGKDLSAATVCETLRLIEGKDVCLNVISKSGTTTEPAVAFRIFKEWMEEKYGDGAAERIYVTTDKARGKLKELSDTMGYETFVVPDDVGGRFSVLSPVGLLPIACAGIDVNEMLEGAREAKAKFSQATSVFENDCLKYAAIRNVLLGKGKSTEILASYEPALGSTAEWWKQLYGESEGKGKNGIFPASVTFTTDLHSLGQFIQDGTPRHFETVIDLLDPGYRIEVPYDEKNSDGLNFIALKQLHDVNRTAFAATAMAHTDGGVPNIVLEVSGRSAHDFGMLVYFFELACAVSGYILGVNPFDQPGVEAYKKNMFALLGKPGAEFDALRASLSEKMK